MFLSWLTSFRSLSNQKRKMTDSIHNEHSMDDASPHYSRGRSNPNPPSSGREAVAPTMPSSLKSSTSSLPPQKLLLLSRSRTRLVDRLEMDDEPGQQGGGRARKEKLPLVLPPSVAHSTPLVQSREAARGRPSGERDFPPGCGPHPLPAALRPGAARRAAVRQFPGAAGIVVKDGEVEDDRPCQLIRDATSGRPSTRHPSLMNPQDNQARRTISPAKKMRIKVKETLKYFRDTCKELQKVKRSSSFQSTTHNHLLLGESSAGNDTLRRVDLKASKMLKMEGKYMNTVKVIGSVPGIEIGDKFQYRVELNIVGLHHRLQNGIDYLKDANGHVLATSIVSCGDYDHVDGNSGNLAYMGEGGLASGRGTNNGVTFRDQKLVRGNLALKNSIRAGNPVRVIRRIGDYQGNSFEGGLYYQYDGLYIVRRFSQKRGDHGKLVFMFELARKSDDS